jgi:methionyl-tRNA synthetase
MGYYVTTPIYYVNAEPHLGHAYTTIAADILARHMRQRGEDVFFLTGTDEHGEPVAQAAERLGVAPRELADRNAPRFRDMAARVGATNDFFIRTSDEQHVRAVQDILQRVHDRGHVYKGLYEGWYCPRCADFKTEGELEEGNRCPIHRIELTRESEENYFFRLSSFQQSLERLYDERPDWVLPESRYNEARAFIDQGLNDISLSRSTLTWGVPVPWDPEHVFYVWFDALLNYYTALTYARRGEDLRERFWPATVHVMAKDILKFHAVIWPALLMAAELPVPRRLFIHGYLLMEEQKMSKSLGNVIDPFQVIDLFGTDALRYYLFREVAFGGDGSVSAEGFETRYTSELANEYGNLASRTLAMVTRYRDGTVPPPATHPELADAFEGLVERVCERFDRVDVSGALEEIWAQVRRLNQWVQEEAPWQLAKDARSAQRLDAVLYGLVEGLRVISTLLHPFMPHATERLLDAIGAGDRSIAAAGFGAGERLAAVQGLEPLFPRIESEARPAA